MPHPFDDRPLCLKRSKSTNGWGILEMMIALSIIVIATSYYFTSERENARFENRINEQSKLLLTSQNLIEWVHASARSNTLSDLDTGGQTADNIAWQIEMRPFSDASPETNLTPELRLIEIVVSVRNQRANEIEFSFLVFQ